MGRTKWPATYTRYFACTWGDAVTACTPVTVIFPLEVRLCSKKERKEEITMDSRNHFLRSQWNKKVCKLYQQWTMESCCHMFSLSKMSMKTICKLYNNGQWNVVVMCFHFLRSQWNKKLSCKLQNNRQWTVVVNTWFHFLSSQ